MAERERLTNKERRAQAREERKRKEAEAAAKRKRGQLRNGLLTAAVVALIAVVAIQAFTGGPANIEDQQLVSASAAEDAREAAGCEVLVDEEPLPQVFHVDSVDELDRDETYGTEVRPAHSGPHTQRTHPVVPDSDSPIDERSTTHNLEHGSIITYYDPAQVEGDTADEIGTWSETLNANDFEVTQAGSGLLSAPSDNITSGKAVAFRAWGVAMDCDEWDETVAESFVIENYGTRGIGPEGSFAPYPEGVLDYEDSEVEETDPEERDEAPEDEGDESETPDEGEDGEDGGGSEESDGEDGGGSEESDGEDGGGSEESEGEGG